MKSKIIKQISSLLFCLIVFISPLSVQALEGSSSTNIQLKLYSSNNPVPIDKTWKIDFNLPLSINTIKENNIYVTDDAGNIIPMFYSQNYGEDMSISVIPVKNYEYGKAYTLWIKDLISKNGKALSKNIKMPFTTVQKTANIEEVVVSNTKELLENIGPNKTIILKSGDYNLLDSTVSNNIYIKYEKVYDGSQLVINNVANLTLKAEADTNVNLLIHPRYANVLNFRNCNDINISGVIAGHYPDEGYCTGGVFAFDDSKNINIDTSELFGCGTEGLTLNNVENLTFTNSIIKECSYGIMTLNNCKNIKFNDSEFRDNREFSLINLSACTDITFNKCKIHNNLTDRYFSDYYLFQVDEYSRAIVKDCSIFDNEVSYLTNNVENVIFTNVDFNNNSFD